MDANIKEQIIQSFNYSKSLLNSINITGIDNCQRISTVYNNIDVFLNMVNNGDISIVDNNHPEPDLSKPKQKSTTRL